MFLQHCSAVIITKNAAQTLPSCLAALTEFAEVVIYDNGSTDQTAEIAAQFANVRYFQGDFFGFGDTKNHAASLAQNDWIFSIDADETPDKVLLAALATFPADDPNAVGRLVRENYFCGRAIHTGGWGNDALIRLYHRQKHQFCGRAVHEQITCHADSRVIPLAGVLRHDAITDLSQQLQKTDHYSNLYATLPEAKSYSFPWIVVKMIFAFWRSYLLKGGILSGWRGFAIAVGDSIGVFYKYGKIYAAREGRK